MRSNCAIYAVRRFLREGGYVVISRSRHGWWWHVRYTADFQTFTAFVMRPRDLARWHARPMWRKAFPPCCFEGVAKTYKE